MLRLWNSFAVEGAVAPLDFCKLGSNTWHFVSGKYTKVVKRLSFRVRWLPFLCCSKFFFCKYFIIFATGYLWHLGYYLSIMGMLKLAVLPSSLTATSTDSLMFSTTSPSVSPCVFACSSLHLPTKIPSSPLVISRVCLFCASAHGIALIIKNVTGRILLQTRQMA